MEMIKKLVENNKQFEYMVYPNKNHSIYGGTTRLHLFTKMSDFILNYKDKYHGIGFHYFSQPIQFLTHNIIGKIDNINSSYLLSFYLIDGKNELGYDSDAFENINRK